MREYTNLDEALQLLAEGWELHHWHVFEPHAFLRHPDAQPLGRSRHIRMSTFRAMLKRHILIETERDLQHAVFRGKV